MDYNNDGLFDALEFNIFVSNVPSTSIKNIKLLLLFNLTLSAYANLKLESLGYLESYNSKSSSEVSISGALQFVQTKVLKDKASYDYSVCTFFKYIFYKLYFNLFIQQHNNNNKNSINFWISPTSIWKSLTLTI